MRAFIYWLTCLLLIGILACGHQSSPRGETELPKVMTVEAWKELEPSLKYDPNSIEQLRSDNEQFKTERAWKKFMDDVVLPEMKRQTTRPD